MQEKENSNFECSKEKTEHRMEILKHFQSVVDKIDTEEWKPEWEYDSAEMTDKSIVRDTLMTLYTHHKPFTEEVLRRAIGYEAFDILTTLHILSPWKNGIYYMNWHYSDKSKYPEACFDNLGENLIPKKVFGLDMDKFLDLLMEIAYIPYFDLEEWRKNI